MSLTIELTWTVVGQAAIAAAVAKGSSAPIQYIGIGEGLRVVDGTETALTQEVIRAEITHSVVSGDGRTININGEVVAPHEMVVREIGLFLSDGTLACVASQNITALGKDVKFILDAAVSVGQFPPGAIEIVVSPLSENINSIIADVAENTEKIDLIASRVQELEVQMATASVSRAIREIEEFEV